MALTFSVEDFGTMESAGMDSFQLRNVSAAEP
jgi:hypothetical protein